MLSHFDKLLNVSPISQLLLFDAPYENFILEEQVGLLRAWPPFEDQCSKDFNAVLVSLFNLRGRRDGHSVVAEVNEDVNVAPIVEPVRIRGTK